MENLQVSNPEKEQPEQQKQQLTSFCAERMQWALRMFPVQLRPELETQAEYMAEWLEIADEIGTAPFSEALVMAVRNSEFFPTIKKIRDCAGITEEKKGNAGAEAAWLYLQDYIRKWFVHPDIGQDKNAPKLPPRIAHAVRSVGGIIRVEYAESDSVPFIKRDFLAAWKAYNESAAAYNDLQLTRPLTPLLLEMPKAE